MLLDLESNGGLIKTTLHGMGQDAFVVTEDKVDSFNNYSSDFQIWLALSSIAVGAVLSGLENPQGMLFKIAIILTIIFSVFLCLSYKKFNKTRKTLFIKTEDVIYNNQNLRIINAVYGTDDKFYDVTEKLKSLVIESKLTVAVKNEIFGDPHFGVKKSLRICYIYDDKSHIRTFEENTEFKLP